MRKWLLVVLLGLAAFGLALLPAKPYLHVSDRVMMATQYVSDTTIFTFTTALHITGIFLTAASVVIS